MEESTIKFDYSLEDYERYLFGKEYVESSIDLLQNKQELHIKQIIPVHWEDDPKYYTEIYHCDFTNFHNRCMRASKDINNGELIIKTLPIASVVQKKYAKARCHFCFAACDTLKVCSICKYARYCKHSCQRNDWSDHKLECQLIKHSYLKHDPYKLPSLVLLASRIYNMMTQVTHAKFQTVFKENIRQFREMLSSPSNMSKKKRDGYIEMSYLVAKFNNLEINGINMEIMFEIFSSMDLNLFAICNEEYEYYSYGLYYPSNYINHSCAPNASVIYQGTQQFIRALTPISKDQEIVINYVDIGESSIARRQHLMEQYGFKCPCVRCLRDIKVDLFKYAMKCPCGRGSYTMNNKVCNYCHKNIKYPHWKKNCRDLEILQQLNDKAKQLEIDGRESKALDMYLDIYKIQGELLGEMNYKKEETLEAIVELSLKQGKFKEAYIFCMELFRLCQQCFPPNMPNIAVIEYKIGKLEVHEEMLESGFEHLKNAYSILKNTHRDCVDYIGQLYHMIVSINKEIALKKSANDGPITLAAIK